MYAGIIELILKCSILVEWSPQLIFRCVLQVVVFFIYMADILAGRPSSEPDMSYRLQLLFIHHFVELLVYLMYTVYLMYRLQI